MRALLIALALLPISAQAAPIYYDAVYDVYNVHGTAPSDWGALTLGSTVQLQFGYDTDLVVDPSAGGWDANTVFSYVLTAGDATIFSGPISVFRNAGSNSIQLDDIVPRVCTPPDPCAGGFGDWIVDDVLFNFQCSSWASQSQLLSNFDCAGPITGNVFFELFTLAQQPDFGIAASLREIKRTEIPEPSASSLLMLGLAATWIARRRQRLSATS